MVKVKLDVTLPVVGLLKPSPPPFVILFGKEMFATIGIICSLFVAVFCLQSAVLPSSRRQILFTLLCNS
ncbi:MAG: hypothetical protein WA364_15300 [Candidatus Nitrosopolaris sp.]